MNNKAHQAARNLVGTKVKVLVSLRPVVRVLREDADGFYICYQNEHVPVKAKFESTVLTFLALTPQNREAIERNRQERKAKQKAAEQQQAQPDQHPEPQSPKKEPRPNIFTYHTLYKKLKPHPRLQRECSCKPFSKQRSPVKLEAIPP
ncbi:hypothetical protein LC040_05900 [Bacillus tianshenii]|nr:hypothetical protein LC040_05900 [Bacillus tianshenii]